ncbi:hypothetical protein O1611_g2296 [Lasiodiplodia mahajangana]|uniref:Uncharacterized protein n=1 Tax=Lasiodiplodia mahajangana TaxID=1108764 RepID=A0ACC2JUY1_9PEZI|nr:hypothetical protein O1611_g2296 [Lasiodiplodia mahajangana]
MVCGYEDPISNSPRGRGCSNPQGSTTYVDKPCRPEADSAAGKHKTRREELLAQLGHQDNTREVQHMLDQSRNLDLNMRRGISEAQQILYGPRDAGGYTDKHSWCGSPGVTGRTAKAPWELDSDEDSDDGQRDTSYLTLDGKHVIQKQYKLINGHWALISYRKELHEVDHFLLLQLQEKRERELAKERRKTERKGTREGDNSNIDQENHCRDPTSLSIYRAMSFEAGEYMAKGKQAAGEPNVYQTPTTSWNFINEARAAIVRDHQTQPQIGGVKRLFWDPPLNRYETPTPPPSPPPPDEEDFRRMLDMWRDSSLKREKAREERLERQTAKESAPPPPSFKMRAERIDFDSPEELYYNSGNDFEDEQDAESSSAPARCVSGESTRHTQGERFDQDIIYNYLEDNDSANSHDTVHETPVYEPLGWRKSASWGKSQSRASDEEEEDLDVWQKIADEDTEGKKPQRRVRFELPPDHSYKW